MPKKTSGFTLVELMVVFTIIAILAIVGLTIFTEVQKKGRDSKRKADIDAISKAMEVHFEGGYSPLSKSWFSSDVVPTDPLTGELRCGGADKLCRYCDRIGSGVGFCEIANPYVKDGIPDGTAGYIVCADLESSDYYCIKNQQ